MKSVRDLPAADAELAPGTTDPDFATPQIPPEQSLAAALAAFNAQRPADVSEAESGEAFGLLVPMSEAVVARVHVVKHAHRLELLDAVERPIARFRVAMGGGGLGNKKREGDKITPTGRYHVIRRNHHRYHNFLLLDYPNELDQLRFDEARKKGQLPWWATIGSAVGIHGGTRDNWIAGDRVFDWTNGCVAVKDSEIDLIDNLVPDGTPVDIED
jgi:murein L,D-transpeptidase YafK